MSCRHVFMCNMLVGAKVGAVGMVRKLGLRLGMPSGHCQRHVEHNVGFA